MFRLVIAALLLPAVLACQTKTAEISKTAPTELGNYSDGPYVRITLTDDFLFYITIPDPYRDRDEGELLIFDVTGNGEIIIGGRKVRFEDGNLVAVKGLTKWPKEEINIVGNEDYLSMESATIMGWQFYQTKFCPTCRKEGLKSTVSQGTCTSTAMYCGDPTWDENGKYAPVRECNTTTCEYTCSNGHHWGE